MTSRSANQSTGNFCQSTHLVCTPTEMFRRIERHVRYLEMRFGRERLLRVIAGVQIDHLSKHTDDYRTIVRTGQWLNEDRPTPFPIFCSEFERSAIAYINVGFNALDFLADGIIRPLEKIYPQVIASEALRGQFGKRSPNGLDKRLDRGVDKLISNLLKWRGGDVSNDEINLLCTPTRPWLSAETMLLEDFAMLRKSFITPPSIDEILSADAGRQEIAWTFLRRHSRWNVGYMQRYYISFNTSLFDEWVVNCRRQRSVQAVLRRDLLDDISKNIHSKAASEIIAIANEVTILNQINLAVEPCFSFKGGPGVAHGLIFKAAADSGFGMQITHDQQQNKWGLLFATTLKE